jgi:hypothetical protein
MTNPDARRQRLLVQEAGEELVIYDQDRRRVHRLNRAAALVWRSCDGENTVADLAMRLHNELSPHANEHWVWQALERLERARLLKEPVTRSGGGRRVSRRQALGTLARTAPLLILLPVVATMVVPSRVWADGPDDENCDGDTCTDACPDQCKRDSDCPREKPDCMIVQCNHKDCTKCTKRICTKEGTPR